MEPPDSVTIGHAGATLTFKPIDPVAQTFTVLLEAPGLTASDLVEPGHFLQGTELVEFFQALAADWKGWDGPREWFPYTDNFRMTCWHDRVGHVAVQVEIGREPVHAWPEPEWKLTAQVIVDPGALSAIASALGTLFR